MCGIFGYVTRDEQAIDLDIIQKLAIDTESRGRHAWGVAWIDRAGIMHHYKQPGAISNDLELLCELVRNARVLVGHCRFATAGSARNNLNNHPFACDGGFIVHNGCIVNHVAIALENQLYPVSECDSEILALLVERLDGSITTRCKEAVEFVESPPLAMVGIWKPDTMIVVKDGNPLFAGIARSGLYVASRPNALPTCKNFPKVFDIVQGMTAFSPQTSDAKPAGLMPYTPAPPPPCREFTYEQDDIGDASEDDEASCWNENPCGPRPRRATRRATSEEAPPLFREKVTGSRPRFDYWH